MSNYNLRVNTARTICWVTVLSDALPATAGTTLTDFNHGPGVTTDLVDNNPDNHVLYHDIASALYRQLGIQDMQRISIVFGGALAADSITAAAISVAAAATATLVLKYQPADATAVNADFTYATSDETKATVSVAGVVTGVAAGAAVITATHKATGAVATCAITVTAE